MTSAASARCVDAGVMVAAFAPWHERHSDAMTLMVDQPRVVAHFLVETYSVLTRLPAPFRAPAAVVAESLARRFPDDPPAPVFPQTCPSSRSMAISSTTRRGLTRGTR